MNRPAFVWSAAPNSGLLTKGEPKRKRETSFFKFAFCARIFHMPESTQNEKPVSQELMGLYLLAVACRGKENVNHVPTQIWVKMKGSPTCYEVWNPFKNLQQAAEVEVYLYKHASMVEVECGFEMDRGNVNAWVPSSGILECYSEDFVFTEESLRTARVKAAQQVALHLDAQQKGNSHADPQ